MSTLRDFDMERLLNRKPMRWDEHRVGLAFQSCSVLITGAAGSIGSELARQIISLRPQKLILFDRAESDLFTIDLELRQKRLTTLLLPIIGDIQDANQIGEVLLRHRVDVVFHAAAYKHVPMMEAHVIEAVRNNAFGTRTVLNAAAKSKVGKFVLISSDKAVNPTTVMGATKRLCEMMVAAAEIPGWTSVRLANVLGSSGSVVKIFMSQIASGGPVTVTHPDARRCFLTIPEAAQLIVEASTMATDSEAFLLDSGSAVPIIGLARRLICLSGRNPREIRLEVIGLRPGEKLCEDMLGSEEHSVETHHENIKLVRRMHPTKAFAPSQMRQLEYAVARRYDCEVVSLLARIIPEYTPSDHWAPIPDFRGVFLSSGT
jgi:FlaA1/EpsC-like NDP-sugar epimerase